MARSIRLLAAMAAVLAVSTAAFVTAAFVTAALATAGAAGRSPTVSAPATAGKGVNVLSPDVSSKGYKLDEFFISGTAANYQPVGKLTSDGKWIVKATATAPFKTRMAIWKPADAAAFNGTVFVEWLNVSPGFDNPPDWLSAHNQIIREGGIWVGVSAQKASITGGQVIQVQNPLAPPAGGLVGADPARYGTLKHPGDAFSYDIFTQAGEAIRGKGSGPNPLAGYHVKHVIAMGESQSAFRMTTYVDAIQPLAKVYDGFLIHSRGAQGSPFGAQTLGKADPTIPSVVRIRSDLGVPVITVETETDLIRLGYLPAQQRDSKNFRLWEVAGTSHADAYFERSLSDLGDGSAEAAMLDPAQASGGALHCSENANAGAAYEVVSAALVGLEKWVRTGTPPPKAPRMKTTGTGTAAAIVRDAHGIALGGIRSPIVEAPIATNDGLENAGGSMCFLFGHTKPFAAATLATLYPNGAADYVKAFDKAADKTVKAGFWLKTGAALWKAAARKITFG